VYKRQLLLLVTLTLLPACGIQIGSAGQGNLAIESRRYQNIDIGGTFDTGYFAVDEKNAVTVVLLEGDPEAPTAAMIVRMFWLPVVGETPIDRTATNASVSVLVFGPSIDERGAADDASGVGLYAGAGFLYINSKLKNPKLKAGLWEANIQLADSSQGFVDQVGPSLISGAVRATRDDERVAQLLRQLSQQATDQLGYPRMVLPTAPSQAVARAD